jgi:8-oxo-dGTP pyrophosphatase MutT (NUDIX family)
MKMAFGGVVFDHQGRVLIRRPTGDFDGYVWTFPKGRAGPNELPEEAALRETLEETGIVAEIIDRISGSFDGSTTTNVYYLMRPLGPTQKPHWETADVRWVTVDEAYNLIQETKNQLGRERDLKVLVAASRLWVNQHQAPKA